MSNTEYIDRDEADIDRIGPWTADKLLSLEFPEPRWIVPGLFPEGLTILAGRPKVGKSWLALDLCIAVAGGRKALGTIQCEPGDALYLSLEDNPRRLQSRLRKLLGGDDAPPQLKLVCAWPRLDQGGLDKLRDWIEKTPTARLIVIDTLARVRSTDNTRDMIYAADYAAVEGLQTLAGEHALAIIMVHHQRKAAADDPLDQVSGSTGLTAGVDSVFLLNKESGRADAVLYGRGRDVEETQSALKFDGETGRWLLLGPAEEYKRSAAATEIINLLHEIGEPMSPKAVSEALSKNHSTTKVMLAKMARDGQIENPSLGMYTTRKY